MFFRDFTERIEQEFNLRYRGQASASLISVTKNNGKVLTGLSIERKDYCIAPTIYLDAYYDRHEDGEDIDVILNEIFEIFEIAGKETAPDMSFFDDYELMKERILVKVINTSKNEKLLTEVPHVDFLDLSAVFYCIVMMGKETGTVLIRNEFLKRWKVDAQTLYDDALSNNRRLLGTSIVTMEEILIEMMEAREAECDKEDREELEDFVRTVKEKREQDPMPSMYVCGNREKFLGASQILCEDTLNTFAAKTESDFYILPSSIHELIFIPAYGNPSPFELASMVREVNRTQVLPEEILSDSLYYFSREQGKVIMTMY